MTVVAQIFPPKRKFEEEKKTQIIQFFQNFFDAGKRKTVTNHANILCSKRFRAKSCVHFT